MLISRALLIAILLGQLAAAQALAGPGQLRESFAHPPDDCRIMMRWWWFGPAATKAEIQRELEQMKAAGIGGVEIATLYPLALDDPATDFRTFSFLSEEHIDALRFAADEAHRLGLRVDITLGSGWPYGGPHIPVTQAAGEMRVETVTVAAGSDTVPVPNIEAGEQLVAVFLVPGSASGLALNKAKYITTPAMENGRLQLSNLGGANSVVFFISSRTGMTVKRAAIGAEGFVLDHYDADAIQTHLHAVGDRLMQAFGDHPPYAIFSDSLEDNESDWTPGLMQEFRNRRGYDLTPHLPALIGDAGPETAAIRHDWGKTLTELANEHYLQPLRAWAAEHHTLLRSQTYGTPPVTLSSNRYVDLPEGEGKATLLMWRQFSDTRWAASAGHLFGKPVISSETWTWLHSPAFRATPLDLKAEADLHFLQGINQLVGHGWPYSPESAGEPGWRMYAAGAFNAHNPWWFAMPDVSAYLQRVSFALRQGKPANDIALLLPNDDAWAAFVIDASAKKGSNGREGGVSIDESMMKLLGSEIIPQILDAGFNFDFTDPDAIETVGISHAVLIVPGVERMPLSTYKKIEQYAQHGGIVIATRRLPSTAPGLVNAEAESLQINKISKRLFRGALATAHFIEDESQLGRALASYIQPDVVLTPPLLEIGFIHRRLSSGDLYFVANTSNRLQTTRARFRERGRYAEVWDPSTGRTSPLADAAGIELSLQPYESRLIFFSDSKLEPGPRPRKSAPTPEAIDLSLDWIATRSDSPQSFHIRNLHSWSDDESTKYFSGQITYERSFDLASFWGAGASAVLDFGDGTAVPKPDPLPAFNMRAYLDSPVREAADVYVNGRHAGIVWHPPYTLDVSAFLKAGKNDIRIVVGNTAINSMAGHSLPDYRLLNDRYGQRFVPQDMEHLQPLPSGILGGVRIRMAQ